MTTGLVIERGDPHTPEAKALLEASHALMQELFTPDANHFLSLDALAAPDIAFFVARLDGRMVGCGALAIRDGYGEIKSMFVDPDTRRAGVAAGLIGRLEAEAKARGLAMLRLETLRLETGNLLHAAQALYQRHGFTIRGPFGSYSEHPQPARDRLGFKPSDQPGGGARAARVRIDEHRLDLTIAVADRQRAASHHAPVEAGHEESDIGCGEGIQAEEMVGVRREQLLHQGVACFQQGLCLGRAGVSPLDDQAGSHRAMAAVIAA